VFEFPEFPEQIGPVVKKLKDGAKSLLALRGERSKRLAVSLPAL
jgi:hypothetical protein